MMKRLFLLLTGITLLAAPARAQDQPITGKVTTEALTPMSGVQVVIKGTTTGVLTNGEGVYSIRARTGQVLQYRFIGHAPVERTIATETVLNVMLRRVASQLDAMVVTALGQQANVFTDFRRNRLDTFAVITTESNIRDRLLGNKGIIRN